MFEPYKKKIKRGPTVGANNDLDWPEPLTQFNWAPYDFFLGFFKTFFSDVLKSRFKQLQIS